jgi:hypothetical protein
MVKAGSFTVITHSIPQVHRPGPISCTRSHASTKVALVRA